MQKFKNNSLFIFYLALTIAVFFSSASAALAKNGTSTVKSVSNQNGQVNALEHRSTVASFIQILKEASSSMAGGIGEQVKVIAQQQEDSDATTTKAIETIQSRNKIKTFLIGSDYKNLGALRSEIVKTRNRIDQLGRAIKNATDTAEIQAQIQILEQEQTKIENFITAQEGKFSLFGWLVKLLAGYQNSSQSSLSSTSTPTSTLITQVTYACSNNKTIDAAFYKGETKSVEPGEMPIPSGSVKIVLSDGRSFDLPQTVSADGGRYANSDESFVFWSKGDGVTILENNIEKDYKGCVVSPENGIIVISPNGGETWIKGQKVQISWKAAKEIKFVNIRLSISGNEDGQNFNAAIVSNLPNTDKYEWTVQNLYAEVLGITALPTSDKYLLTIEDSEHNNVYDTSDVTFSIKGTAIEQACISSEGTVGTALCCNSAKDFPNSCLIGACGCSPANSHQINICNCGEGKCFNGSACVIAQ